jgi:tRNA-dihydrouridine synthase B
MFAGIAGLMVGRLAIARPWVFATWERPLEIDPGSIWLRLHDYIAEDFEPDTAIKRVRLFTKYFARNFQFGHGFDAAVRAAPTMAAARAVAERFFDAQPALHAEASMLGL